jgi:hypothetical protein
LNTVTPPPVRFLFLSENPRLSDVRVISIGNVFDLLEKIRSLDGGQKAYLSITHVWDINNYNFLALGVGKLGTIRSKITSDLSTGLNKLPFKTQKRIRAGIREVYKWLFNSVYYFIPAC